MGRRDRSTYRTRLRVIGLAVAIAMVSAGVGAWAADQFSDVPNDHPFHDEIGWMADREVSEGFSDGTFRPGDEVTRQAVAAFMERFGDVMTPTYFSTTGPLQFCAPQPCTVDTTLDLDADPVACRTSQTTEGYEQRAVIDGKFAVQANGDLAYWAYPVYREDGATSWTRMTPDWSGEASVDDGEFGTLPVSGYASLDPSTTYEFGLQVVRSSNDGGSNDVSDYWCSYMGELQNRQPSS